MNEKHKNSPATVAMAFAAIGIVFGDIGTSPMYAMHEAIHATGLPPGGEAVLGVASLIFWTLTLIVSIKYILFIMMVDNNGEGGIFALVSVLKARVSSSSVFAQSAIVALTVISVSLLFADSLITPPLSIMAAIEGVEMIDKDAQSFVMSASIVILIGLFGVQRFGTHALSRFFSPIMLCWFVVIGLLGFVQVLGRPDVLNAVSPIYALNVAAQLSWPQLLGLFGSVLLAATGAEAIYLDMGHFGRKPIAFAWYGMPMIALLLSYFGQSAWLLENRPTEANAFFAIVPSSLLIPLVILATLASIIAGQAVISGMFSIVNQAIGQGYLPRIKVLQTSAAVRGQIYVPVVNQLLLAGTVMLVLAFGSSSALASSYGFAVSATMLLTTLAFSAVILVVWKWSVWKVVAFVFFALPLDILFFAATITKLPASHFFTLIVALSVAWLMVAWIVGDRLLMRRAQRIDIPVSDFAEITGFRSNLHLQRRPAVFLQHLPLPAEVRATPLALLQQVQLTSILYQPTVIVEFLSSSVPRVGEKDRIVVHEYPHNVKLVYMTFGFWESLSLEPMVKLGQQRGWWSKEEDLVYYSVRENLRLTQRASLPLAIRWPYALLHKLDQRILTTLKLDPTRCVELGVSVDI
jgi:KUP system potassium uptake protein